MIENSEIGLRCIIGENVTIRYSIVIDSDDYELNDQPELIPLGIGNGSSIEGAIIDKNCRIGRNVRVANDHKIQDGDPAEQCVVRDGIPIVLKDATLPDGWKR